MELYDVMRTTFAVREFTDDPLPDPVLYRILDNARFAPSGGNRQGTHIVAVRDAALRKRLGEPWIIATVAGAGYRIDTQPDTGREGGDRG